MQDRVPVLRPFGAKVPCSLGEGLHNERATKALQSEASYDRQRRGGSLSEGRHAAGAKAGHTRRATVKEGKVRTERRSRVGSSRARVKVTNAKVLSRTNLCTDGSSSVGR